MSKRFVCFTRRPTLAPDPGLYCVDIGSRIARLVREGPVDRIVANDGESQVAFTDVSSPTSTALYVANLDTWLVVGLGTTGADGFRFLPGGRRLAAWRGPDGGATLYDLASGWQIKIAPTDEGVNAVVSIPGSDRRVILARRRGSTPELVNIEGLPE